MECKEKKGSAKTGRRTRKRSNGGGEQLVDGWKGGGGGGGEESGGIRPWMPCAVAPGAVVGG